MAVVTTPILKLKIDSSLTPDAKYNLYKLDNLASLYQIDTNETARIRSKRNIILQPNDPDVSGSGTGGSISIGSPDQPADDIGIHATNITMSGNINSENIKLTNSGYTFTILPPTLTGNLSLTLPIADGSANQVLQTDGAGQLSWATLGGLDIGQELSASWIAADGMVKTVTHGFGTRKVMVEVLDSSDNYRTVELDSVSRPTDNTVILESSIAPASSWIILLKQIP